MERTPTRANIFDDETPSSRGRLRGFVVTPGAQVVFSTIVFRLGARCLAERARGASSLPQRPRCTRGCLQEFSCWVTATLKRC